MRDLFLKVGAILAAGASLFASTANADNFYSGKQVTVIVGSGAGSVNDAYARLVARHFRRHLPGSPNVIIQNLPGASGVTATAQLYNNRPRDGTVIAAIQRTILLEPLLIDRNYPYDIMQFNWLGSLNRESNVLIVSDASKLKRRRSTGRAESFERRQIA